jgi:hypothetical protein
VRPSRNFNFMGWVLVVLMALYFMLIIVPKANGEEPRPKARLLLEIKEEHVRIFEYETPRMLCHVTIITVRMVGAQVTSTCVRKYDPHRVNVGPPLR